MTKRNLKLALLLTVLTTQQTFGMDATLFDGAPASSPPVSAAPVTTKELYQQTQTAVQLATEALEVSARDLGIDLATLLAPSGASDVAVTGGAGGESSPVAAEASVSGAIVPKTTRFIKQQLALLTPSVEELASRKDQRLHFAPKDKRFTDYYNTLVLGALKPFIATGFDGPKLALAVGSFHENFLPIAAGLKAYIKNIPGGFDQRKTWLLKDLDDAVERGTLSFWDIFSALGRMQFIQKEMTTDEVDLLNSLPEPMGSITRAYQETKGRNTSNMSMLLGSEAGYKQSLAGLSPYQNIFIQDIKLQKEFDQILGVEYQAVYLQNQLPMNLLPVLGRGVLGLHFMLESWIQGKHYVAFPTVGNMTKAHGVNGAVGMSPFAFSIHDMFHAWVDFRTHAVKAFAIELINKHRTEHPEHKDKDQKPLMSLALRNAQDHYELMTDGLLALLYSMDKEVLEGRRSAEEYRKFISGFFWALHEPTSVNYVDLFKEESLAEIVRKLTAGAITPLERSAGEDKLRSYPFEDTAPQISDEELKALLLLDDSGKYTSVKIERTPSFVIVSGTEVGEYSDKPFTRPLGTLYYQYKDAQDNAKGLGLSTLFETPLNGAFKEEGRAEAIKRIDRVNEALRDNLRLFESRSITMAHSLKTAYTDDFGALDGTYNDALREAFSDAAASGEVSSAVVVPAVEASRGLDVVFEAPGYSLSYVVDSISSSPIHKFISFKRGEGEESPRALYSRSFGGDKTVLFDLHSALTFQDEGSNRYRISLSQLAAVAGADESKGGE